MRMNRMNMDWERIDNGLGGVRRWRGIRRVGGDVVGTGIIEEGGACYTFRISDADYLLIYEASGIPFWDVVERCESAMKAFLQGAGIWPLDSYSEEVSYEERKCNDCGVSILDARLTDGLEYGWVCASGPDCLLRRGLYATGDIRDSADGNPGWARYKGDA